MDVLREAGWLSSALPRDRGGSGLGEGGERARYSVHAFARLAGANMSIARLFEGHVNAIGLIMTYGDADLKAMICEHVRRGSLLGIWGADGSRPVVIGEDGKLDGTKQFASGLGIVAFALITAKVASGTQLCFVRVDDPARQDASSWAMSGMRATVSGTYDFSGLADFETVGEVDAYYREPLFVGGVWRIAAIQAGGTFALLEAARDALRERGRLDAEPQLARLGTITARAFGSLGLVERAARTAMQADGDPEDAVALSIFARLLTEEIAQDAIAAVERSVGLAHFDAASQTGRIARDLAVYIRQAARDAFLQRAAAQVLGNSKPLLQLWNEP
ncbi:acyl-CoA dehydrogenase family protein [Notoacmeibacter sp. MSK16QG-6]|uniref:acyl-CoA dehydrogenase family protein n=1 Tax=Notoacmeibacter sp. MSK16QG-6 TaxID=2957982 RepID=UPI0020A0742A|nr:acyl-CoA dehydrogenase family protein [Notoacmeibacter sp. MSK16QG-6]MCP1200860.1 acyl-CoA/acyl-ACP dehydrogenase [Notoacmeibacter sp. MSK16QG-6]